MPMARAITIASPTTCSKDRIVESAVMGTPVVALCGKVWVPGRDPSKFPVCPDCLKVYNGLPAGGGDDQ